MSSATLSCAHALVRQQVLGEQALPAQVPARDPLEVRRCGAHRVSRFRLGPRRQPRVQHAVPFGEEARLERRRPSSSRARVVPSAEPPERLAVRGRFAARVAVDDQLGEERVLELREGPLPRATTRPSPAAGTRSARARADARTRRRRGATPPARRRACGGRAPTAAPGTRPSREATGGARRAPASPAVLFRVDGAAQLRRRRVPRLQIIDDGARERICPTPPRSTPSGSASTGFHLVDQRRRGSVASDGLGGARRDRVAASAGGPGERVDAPGVASVSPNGPRARAPRARGFRASALRVRERVPVRSPISRATNPARRGSAPGRAGHARRTRRGATPPCARAISARSSSVAVPFRTPHGLARLRVAHERGDVLGGNLERLRVLLQPAVSRASSSRVSFSWRILASAVWIAASARSTTSRRLCCSSGNGSSSASRPDAFFASVAQVAHQRGVRHRAACASRSWSITVIGFAAPFSGRPRLGAPSPSPPTPPPAFGTRAVRAGARLCVSTSRAVRLPLSARAPRARRRASSADALAAPRASTLRLQILASAGC